MSVTAIDYDEAKASVDTLLPDFVRIVVGMVVDDFRHKRLMTVERIRPDSKLSISYQSIRYDGTIRSGSCSERFWRRLLAAAELRSSWNEQHKPGRGAE